MVLLSLRRVVFRRRISWVKRGSMGKQVQRMMVEISVRLAAGKG
jgi:hypothetical protein